MSHISKGDVHAYLDGALGAYSDEAATHVREHLDACRECAQLLEGERRLRQEADAILAASTPGQVELDPFEELQARAREADRQERAEGGEGSEPTRSARPVLGSRLYTLRWAAIVVVSLGAGWMARDLAGPAGEFALDAASELVVQEIALAADQERLEVGDAGVLAEAETSTDVLPEPPALPERLPESQAVVAGVLADALTPSDADTPSDLQIVAARFPAPVPPEAPGAVAARGVRPNADSGDGRLYDNLSLDPVEVFAARARQRAELSSAPAAGAAIGTLSVNPAAIPSGALRSTTPFLVPGLEVLDVRLASEADDLPGVSGTSLVVTQELEDGRIIELQFVPGAGNDPALGAALRERDDLAGRPRRAGWGTARREVPGGMAILSGPLTESELEDLLDLALGPR